MECDQIQGYLSDYVKRNLPTYRLAWVAQHLARCRRCQALMGEITPAPAAAAAERDAASDSYGLQRQVPGWVRPAGAALALLLAASAVVAYKLAADKAAQWRPRAQITEPVQPVNVQTAYQSQQGVTLRIESVVRQGGEVVAEARFSGRGLTVPEVEHWLRAFEEGRQEISAQVTDIRTSPNGISVSARFELPPEQSTFLLRFGAVHQTVWQRWLLLLPDPREPLDGEQPLAGTPSGAKLISYAVEGDLLRIHLRLPGWKETGIIPGVQLRDGEGAIYSPVRSSEAQGFGDLDLELHFPVPKEVRLPLTLIGSLPLDKQIGPWLLEGTVLK